MGALLALLGVVIGAVLTGAAAYWWLERARRTKAAEVSARLLEEGFTHALAWVDMMKEAGQWHPLAHEYLTLDRWREERRSLAARASLNDWFIVATAARTIASLGMPQDRRDRNQAVPAALTDQEVRLLGNADDLLRLALPVLRKYGGT